MAKRVHADDLFVLFPDLPWPRQPTTDGQRARMQEQVEETRARAGANIRRQKAAADRVRATLATRRRR